MRAAAIYLLRDRILLHPWQRTTAGVGLASEPYSRLSIDSDNEMLGAAVFGILERAGRTVEHPASWSGLNKPRLKAAGVNSETAFHSHARYVSIECAPNALRIEPSQNAGTGAFSPLPDRVITVALPASAAQVGTAVWNALEACT